jgi:hypothetical protein
VLCNLRSPDLSAVESWGRVSVDQPSTYLQLVPSTGLPMSLTLSKVAFVKDA